MRSIGLTLLLTALLAGCGFQLKGTADSPRGASLQEQRVAVVSSQPRSELTAAVIQQLQLEGAEVTAPGKEALILHLGPERFVQRNLSLTAQARSAEVELTLSASIRLLRQGDVLVTQTDAAVIRQFLNDPQNIVGKTEELRLLKEEMRRDLAAQISRRITHSISN